MKKIFLALTMFILFSMFYFSANAADYKGKTYVFDMNTSLSNCDALGNLSGGNVVVLKGYLFTVEKVLANNDKVIKFWTFNTSSPVKNTFNLKYFLLPSIQFEQLCSEYFKDQKWNISFGAITTPFKFRTNPSFFTTNLNLGASVSFKKKLWNEFYCGLVGGLSLSSVSLDSFSTNGYVKTATERPAATPSFHLLIGYKNINITVGIGWDIINKKSDIEKSWVYGGQKWIGIGIGVNLFNNGADTKNETSANDKQNKK